MGQLPTDLPVAMIHIDRFKECLCLPKVCITHRGKDIRVTQNFLDL